MKFKFAALVLLPVVFLAGCDLEALSDAENDSLGKLRSGKYSLIDSQELTTLKNDAALAKSIGRYRTEREGFRTWRLDTATGATCLLLTTEADWKKPETNQQSCGN